MTDPESRARDVIEGANGHAAAIGVELVAQWDDGRIMFTVERTTGQPGAGALAVRRLVDLADEADVPVVLDVRASEPALIRFYWRFGFRMFDGTPHGERADLAKLEHERTAYAARTGRDLSDFGVTTMWRDRHAGALEEPVEPEDLGERERRFVFGHDDQIARIADLVLSIGRDAESTTPRIIKSRPQAA